MKSVLQLKSINGCILILTAVKCWVINGHLLYGWCWLGGGQGAQTGGLWKELETTKKKLLVVILLQIINKFLATAYPILISYYTVLNRGEFSRQT